MVLYPAEFHGQSAVEASFQLSDLFHEKEKDIKEIIIETHEPALRIISNKRNLIIPQIEITLLNIWYLQL